MLISGREACEVLAGAGMTTRSARRVLDSGLAGVPTQTRAMHLFEAERVHDLARRPTLPWRTVYETCRPGFFIARREFDVTAPREEQHAALADGWGGVSQWDWFEMSLQIGHHGSLPFIATVSGFVALGCDIVGLRHGSRLLLEEPGPWLTAFEGHRLPTGPGRPWFLHLDRRTRDHAHAREG